MLSGRCGRVLLQANRRRRTRVVGIRAHRLAWLFLAMAFLVDAAAAQDNGFVLYGWGKADCKRFLEVRRAGGGLEQTLRQWVFGFVTAYNIHVASGGDGLHGLEPGAVIDRVEQVCTDDPNLRISGAVNSILGGE